MPVLTPEALIFLGGIIYFGSILGIFTRINTLLLTQINTRIKKKKVILGEE